MKKANLLLGVLSIIVILFSYGCKDNNNENEYYQKGHLVIRLTDAPFPIDMIDAATVYHKGGGP